MNKKQLATLNRVHNFFGILIRENLIKDAPFLGDDEPALVVSDLADDVHDAIHNFPLRNCDVGTAGEQERRFEHFCFTHRSTERCCDDCPAANKAACEFEWMQMPYEEGESDEQK